MRLAWSLVAVCACIEPRAFVRCGDLVCSPDSVCLANQTCAVVPTSPTTLQLDNSTGTTALTDFPLLVPIDGSIVDYARIADPHTDLGLRDAATDADLPVEIVTWNPDGESLVWTRVPVIAAGTFEDGIVVHFGSGANRSSATVGVWDNVDLVVHDAAPDGAQVLGVTSEPAVIGDGLSFPGNGKIEFPSASVLNGWSQFSISFWINPMQPIPPTEPMVIDNRLGARLGRIFAVPDVPEVIRFQIDVRLASTETLFVQVLLEPGVWTRLEFTFDGKTVRAYRDGRFADISSFSQPGTLEVGSSLLQLGRATNGLVGLLDEIRISQRYESRDFVQAAYLSETRRMVRTR